MSTPPAPTFSDRGHVPTDNSVICWRNGDRWVLHVPRCRLTTAVASLADIGTVLRRRLGESYDDPSGWVLDLRGSVALPPLLEAAARIRSDGVSTSEAAVRHRRATARALAREGVPPLDVAHLLALPWERTQALLGLVDRVEPPRSPRLELPLPREATAATGYVHEALFYRDLAELLAGTVPFARAGVVLGQPVIVALPPMHLRAVREALGRDAERVVLVDMATAGANPARIIPMFRQFLDRYAAGGTVRGIGEPIWPGRRACESTEGHLHEALTNLAFSAEELMWLRCPYDIDGLPPDDVQGARLTHCVTVEGSGPRSNPGFDGAGRAEQIFRAPLPLPPPHALVTRFEAKDVRAVRSTVEWQAAAEGVPPDKADKLTVAVSGLAANSIEHGGGVGTLCLWRERNRLVCELSDLGRIPDALAGRFSPDPEAEQGRGLWMAHQLCDLVQVRSSDSGTTVRISTWL